MKLARSGCELIANYKDKMNATPCTQPRRKPYLTCALLVGTLIAYSAKYELILKPSCIVLAAAG